MAQITELARRLAVDISSDNVTWARLTGINDLGDSVSPTKQDASDYDSDGWARKEITMQDWSLNVKFFRRSDTGVFDPVQEILRACRGKFGDDARIYVRYYDRQGRDEAYTGRGIVDWNRSKTGVADLEEVTVTVDGDGPLTEITNPYVPDAVPAVLSATPSGAAAGEQVSITGTGFTGTTAVDFGATPATDFVEVSDSYLVAVVPAGTAGSAAVTVTNATGVSTAFPYTRGA